MSNSAEDLIELLKSTPVVVRALFRGIDDKTARNAPDGGDWSPVEIAAHLADADQRAIERVELMVTQEKPLIEGYDQLELAERRGYRDMALSEQLDRFERLRTDRVAALTVLSPIQWERTGDHNEAGVMTIRELTMWMIMHDTDHLVQISKLVDR